MFRATRDVPPEWTADLEEVIPRSDRLPYLAIRWHAGIEPYGVTQRWTLYTMQPRLDLVPLEMLASLQGPDPREVGLWVTPKVRGADGRLTLGERRWVSESFVSREQWLAYRDTNCFPQLFWIIQGDTGGHKWQLSHAEQLYLKSVGREDWDTPLIGTLPYAEWDNRVKAKIIQQDKLRRWRQSMDWEARSNRSATASGIIVQKERHDQEQAYAKASLAWLEDQITEAVNDIPRRTLAKLFDAVRVSETLPTPDEHDALNEILTTQTASWNPSED